jgi:hypothetical protein
VRRARSTCDQAGRQARGFGRSLNSSAWHFHIIKALINQRPSFLAGRMELTHVTPGGD